MSLYPEGVTEADIDRAFGGGDEADEWCPTCEGHRPGQVFEDGTVFVCDSCGEDTSMEEI